MRMKAQGMAMVPTLKLFSGQPYTKYILLEVQDYAAHGGPILFGTDVGYLTDYDPSEEYRLMVESGFDWPEILASLTTRPAEHFGEQAIRGRITPGMSADIVVVNGDPSSDITALAKPRYVIRQGRMVYQLFD